MTNQNHGKNRLAPGRVTVLWVVITVAMCAYPRLAASQITVGTCIGPSPFTSIQAGVTAAPAGETVVSAPGLTPSRWLSPKR